MSKTRWFFYCWYACDDFPALGGLCKGPFLGRVRCCRLFVRGWFIRGVLLLCGQLLEDFGYFTECLAYVVAVQSVHKGLDSVFRGLAYILNRCVVDDAFEAV